MNHIKTSVQIENTFFEFEYIPSNHPIKRTQVKINGIEALWVDKKNVTDFVEEIKKTFKKFQIDQDMLNMQRI
jgi:hypothetical protein